jgi:hypothetical protein
MFAAALGTPAVVCTSPCLAPAADLEATSDVEAAELLVPLEQLDEINLSIVDDKLAMSLAVEANIQVELTEFALDMIKDEHLKSLTEEKLRSYRQLYNTLNELTGGRADSMLSRAPHVRATAADPSDRAAEPRPKRKRGRGGIGDILHNTATKAILRVRLEIAHQYVDLLRAELELAPPGEFDRRYIGIEVYNQMQVLAMLRVFEQQASPEFGRLIHLATAASEGQVVEARQVVEQMRNTLPLPAAKEQVINTAELSVE